MLLTFGMSTPRGTPTRSSRQGSPRIVKDIEVIYFPPIQFLLFAFDYKASEDSILDFVKFLIFRSFYFFSFCLFIVFCVTEFRSFTNLPNYLILHAISRFWCYLVIVCLVINPINLFSSCAWVLFSRLFAFCGWIVIAF